MKPPPFRYARVRSVADAVTQLDSEGAGARILAGGQSLVPRLRLRAEQPSMLVDIGRIHELRLLAAGDGILRVGACVTHRMAQVWSLDAGLDVMSEAVAFIGHPAVRTVGTVGGSLAEADPAAEWAAVALVLDCECDVTGPGGSRTIPATELATGPFTNSLDAAELITEARFRVPEPAWGTAFREVPRGAGGSAIAGAAAVLGLSASGVAVHARVGLIGVGRTASRARATEAALLDRLADDRTLRSAAELVRRDVDPVDDDAAAYRARLAVAVTRRALFAARDRASAHGEEVGTRDG